MIWTLLIISSVIIILVIAYHQLEKKKYNDTTYLSNLQDISLFFDTIQKFNDYVTWVERDKIKTRFSAVGKFFKNKSFFYKKEEKVKRFNLIFQNFDNYISTYNKNYIQSQKEKLNLYFDNVEGKKLDEQQRTALITDEYFTLAQVFSIALGHARDLCQLSNTKLIISKLLLSDNTL